MRNWGSSIVKAQSTLFNIPSTDVVATQRVYVEFDFISHLEAHQKGGFQAYIPRVVVGVAKSLEAGANVAFLDTISPDQPVEFQPNIKYQFYKNEEYEVAAAAGAFFIRRSLIGPHQTRSVCSTQRLAKSSKVIMGRA